jgi:CDP-6-deoxy-D-xylo-4-hexulose-3-dehydrase
LPNEIFDHKYVYDEIGYNLKPIELQAAMGLQQLDKLPEIHALRRRNYQLLFNIYEKYEQWFHLPRAQDRSDPSWFAFPVTVRKDAGFHRSDMVDYLEENLIQTRPYFAGNIMLQPAYSHLMDPQRAKDDFPMATHAMTHTYFHGTSPVITPEQIAYIGEKVDGFMSLYL